jgi:hypothetical protein
MRSPKHAAIPIGDEPGRDEPGGDEPGGDDAEQPAAVLPASALAGSTHWFEPLQTAGETQSCTLPHAVRHPLGLQVYGAQSVGCPVAPVMVCWPSHVTPATHLPAVASHRSPAAQSSSLVQRSLHAVPSHAYGSHFFVTGVGQCPWPSQLAGRVATPAVQLAETQLTDEPTKPSHDARVFPSHCAAEHGSLAEPVGHAPRDPCGIPATGVHVPGLPATSHASHWPVHAPSQHTPSTQKRLAHAAFDPHAVPGGLVPWHVALEQKAPLAQSPVVAHEDGHAVDAPSQTNGEHVASPAYPFGAVVHTPSAVAPRALEQTSHDPEHAESQQTPSVQWPVAHSRQLP